MSESLEEPGLHSLVEDLDKARPTGFVKFADDASISYSIEDLLEHPLRLYERDNAFRPSALTVQEGSQIDFFETPKPKNFIRLDPYEHRWISEIDVRGHQLPRNPVWVIGWYGIRCRLAMEPEPRSLEFLIFALTPLT